MKKLVFVSTLVALVVATAAEVRADAKAAKEKGKPQTVCPVMGGKINKKYHADYKGKRVYFCCPACIKAFSRNPEKYIKKLEKQGVELESVGKPQTVCPVMGGKINKKYHADYKGKRVYFCCPACIKTFKKDPGKYVKKLEKQGVQLESVGKPQTVCPVMGGKINKKYYADYKGKRVYFCCPACIRTFKKDPEKYIKKLEKQGVNLETVPASSALDEGDDASVVRFQGCCGM